MSFWTDVIRRYEDRRHNADQPLLPPEEIFIQPNQLFEYLNQFSRIIASTEAIELKAGCINLSVELPPRLPVDPKQEQPFKAVKQYVDEANHPVVVGG